MKCLNDLTFFQVWLVGAGVETMFLSLFVGFVLHDFWTAWVLHRRVKKREVKW
jgi:hypothetical protein